MYRQTNIAPSHRLIFRPFPVKMNRKSKRDARAFTSRSTLLSAVACRGVMVADVPRMRNVLNRLEPTTLPIAMSAFFLRAATIEVANSGREVPTETTVRPMILSVIPMDWAMLTAPVTSSRPPPVNPASPSRINKTDFAVE